MNEEISRLMDGELEDDAAFERVVGGMKQSSAMATACYHATATAAVMHGIDARTASARGRARQRAPRSRRSAASIGSTGACGRGNGRRRRGRRWTAVR